MANFTPQEIEEILQQFFDVAGKRQYIGARYVPIFGRKNEDTIQWDGGIAPYEPLTIVLYQGNSYTSRTYVPAGIDILNQQYWALTGNYNAQVEAYRDEVLALDALIPATSFDSTNTVKKYIDDANTAIEDIIPASSFDSTNTVKKYIDDADTAIEDIIPASSFDSTNTVKKYIDDADTAIEDIIPASSFDSTNTVKKYIDDIPFAQTKAYFFGDSWGVSATSESDPTTGNGFILRIATLTGLSINNYHVRGCGFCNAGATNETMIQILNRITISESEARQVKYVFVCAGTNDGDYTQQALGTAMNEYFAALSAKFPYSEIIYTPNYRKHKSALSQDRMFLFLTMNQIAGVRVHVNTSITWMQYSGWWAEDGVHPNPNGYVHFADMICNNLYATNQSFWPVTIGLVTNCPLQLGTISSVYKDGIVHIRGILTAARGFSSAQPLFNMGLSLDTNIFPDFEINSPMYSATSGNIAGMLRLYTDGSCQMWPSREIPQNENICFNFTYLTSCFQFTA